MTFEELKERYDNGHYNWDKEIRMYLSDSLVATCYPDGSVNLFYSNTKDASGYNSYMTINLGKRSLENIDRLFGALKGEEK